MPLRYLITGGAGFIGSHLAEKLIAVGHRVTILDDFSTGQAENLSSIADDPALQIVRDSVENGETVNLLASQCDAVFHLAAAVGVQLVLDEPVRTIRTTIHGTEVVLDAANRFRRPVLITSSSEVYGKGTRVPFSEDDDVVMGPTRTTRYCYAYCKGIDEFLALSYFKQYALPVTVVRLFNTVGPRQVGRYGMVMPRFISAALSDQPLVVHGDGEQTRCFCHVADVVDAMLKLIESPKAVGRVFNLGGEEEISINALARRVIDLARSSSSIQHVSYEQAYGHQFEDMTRRVPKLDRIREVIGFRQTRSLDEMIRSIVEQQQSGD
ncbi:MAG: GDP-mannose 4,6-dehydratase [Phycisphaerae bacterium]|nr:GDP-mannose 4,6-dehydratase [Phycisphaerae bacterium]